MPRERGGEGQPIPNAGSRTCKLVPRSFYFGSPDVVAQKLLGKLLVRKWIAKGSARELAGRIVEVEAYFGDVDPAAHAFAGKTARNAVLFGPPGHAYVYFIYGMHSCLNVSCEPEGRAGCVLIRAVEPLIGLEQMAELRRQRAAPETDGPARGGIRQAAWLASGPGRLCQAFGITRERHNGVDLTRAQSELQIRDDGFPPAEVLVTPRIGIRKAVDLPARFVLAGTAFATRLPAAYRKFKAGDCQ